MPVAEDEDVAAFGYEDVRSRPEAVNSLVQLLGHRGPLRLGKAHHAERGCELIHSPGPHAQQLADRQGG